jgi:hypothetical protein
MSETRVLAMTIKPGTKPKNSSGFTEARIMSGDNKLLVIPDQMSLWSFKYERGGLPPYLQEKKFTTFGQALKFASAYFAQRNIEVIEEV